MMNCESYCRNCKKDVHCCIFKNGGFVFANPKNAEEIKQQTKKEHSYFLDYSPLPKKIVKMLKNCDPSLEGKMRYQQLDNKNRILRLKTKKDKRCIFLDDNGKCEIYSIRPNICRIFPFWAIRLTDGKIKLIAHDINHGCRIIKKSNRLTENIEKSLTRSEVTAIKKVFREIEKEANSYNRQITKFVNELKIHRKKDTHIKCL